MTTIAVKDGVMVGDGRCSLGSTVIKDDMVKVFWINNHLMGGAGRARSISTFAQWLQKHTDYAIVNQEVGDLVDLIPPVLEDDDEFTALVLTPDKQVLMYDGNIALNLGQDVSASIGSGSVFALAAMDAGASAEEAVSIAMKRDVYSGGEITIVQLEQEPQPLTREVAQELSKEELIEMLFGEQETPETVEEPSLIYYWTDGIALLKEGEEYVFDCDGVEYTVGNSSFTEYSKGDMDINEVRAICDHMSIEYSMSNTQSQLMQKIFNEVNSKIQQ